MKKYFYLFMLLTFSSLFFIQETFANHLNYTVKKGDNLYTIAKRHNVSVNAIMEHNNLSSNKLAIGDKISIPQQNKPSVKKETVKKNNENTISQKITVISDPFQVRYHVVKKGDTLTTVAKKYSMSPERLKEINGLSSNKLKVGQQLLIKSSKPEIHTVKKGDTLWSISVKYGISPDELREINGLEGNSLKLGQRLLLARSNQEQEDVTQSAASTLPSYHAKLPPEVAFQKLEDIKVLSNSDELAELSIRERLIIFAKKMLHLPYKFGGNSPFGIDCSAYVQKAYSFIGLALPRSAREQFRFGDVIDKDELSIGDLVFFRTYASFPSHVGIYLGNNLFIHASSKTKRITIDSLDTPYYLKRFIGAKRVIPDDVSAEEGKAIN